MPYENVTDLPDNVRNVLPQHAQEIYLAAYNNAWDQYEKPEDRYDNASREETAHRVAWSAVKNVYEKDDDTNKWKQK